MISCVVFFLHLPLFYFFSELLLSAFAIITAVTIIINIISFWLLYTTVAYYSIHLRDYEILCCISCGVCG